MKAYLQGVKMKNTFSPITCIGKIIFLPITLCTELPLGKEVTAFMVPDIPSH